MNFNKNKKYMFKQKTSKKEISPRGSSALSFTLSPTITNMSCAHDCRGTLGKSTIWASHLSSAQHTNSTTLKDCEE